MTYALTTGVWRHRAAYRGTQDGTQHRKRHPGGTIFGQVGAPPTPAGGLTPPTGSAENKRARSRGAALPAPAPEARMLTPNLGKIAQDRSSTLGAGQPQQTYSMKLLR